MKQESSFVVRLDLGCGKNKLPGFIGVDFLDYSPIYPHDQFIHHDLTLGIPYPDGSVDEICERNLLEHLPNPGFHLSEVARVLRVGGHLRLITDNAACLKYYTLGTHTGCYRKHGGKDKHYSLFTMEHLRNLFEYADLRIEDMTFIDTDYFTCLFDRIVRFFVPSLSYPRIMVKARRKSD